jgi:hypothetical protein
MIVAVAGSSDAVDTLINRSFFLLLFGGNDVFAFANAEQARNRSGAADLQSDMAAFYGSLVSNYSAAIRGLYTLGARRLAVVNVGLAGCLPVSRVLDATGACAEDRNRLANGFNAALRTSPGPGGGRAGRPPWPPKLSGPPFYVYTCRSSQAQFLYTGGVVCLFWKHYGLKYQ